MTSEDRSGRASVPARGVLAALAEIDWPSLEGQLDGSGLATSAPLLLGVIFHNAR